MRYYDLNITDPDSGQTIGDAHWTSYPGGLSGPPDPNALLIEFNIPVVGVANADLKAAVTVWGISLQDITQAADFVGKTVKLSGGMGPGLPLVNPQQSGLLLQGVVFESFANWVGSEMNLVLVVAPGTLQPDANGIGSGNFLLDWKKGTSLQSALTQTFKTAFAKHPIQTVFQLGGTHTARSDQHHVCHTLADLAGAVEANSAFDDGGAVRIYLQADKLIVTDFPAASGSGTAIKTIAFTDLIGQPTWIQTQQAQVTCVLRADIQIGDRVQIQGQSGQPLPGGPGFAAIGNPQVLPNVGANGGFKYQSAFTQPLLVAEVRHIGNSRASDSGEWCTALNCLTTNA